MKYSLKWWHLILVFIWPILPFIFIFRNRKLIVKNKILYTLLYVFVLVIISMFNPLKQIKNESIKVENSVEFLENSDQVNNDNSTEVSKPSNYKGSEDKDEILPTNKSDSSISIQNNPDTTVLAGTLQVHFIDVGQGDSILVIFPSGQNILIDAGKSSASEMIISYLKKAGITSIDIFVATHPDADHIGGAVSIFKEFKIGKIIDSGYVHTTQTYEKYLNYIDQNNIPFELGRTFDKLLLDDNIEIEILSPAFTSDNNNSSVVLYITYGEISFLLTGDAEIETENRIMSKYPDLKVTILKVAHHGSSSSTSLNFIENINPKVAVISVGGNSYGNPSEEILNRLNSKNIDIYRTDLEGSIVISTGGKEYEVNVSPYEYVQSITNQTDQQTKPDNTEVINDKININTASVEELQGIIHIGPVRAEEMISLRPFSTVYDMERITGIGPTRLADIITEGKAYVE